MNKIRSFFTGIFLLAIVFVMAILASLIYRACERSSVKSYMFQMANNSNQRVGMLQNLDDISANELRNKLIKKYVAEYFKVIPGDNSNTNRLTLERMSGPNAFDYWKKTESKKIYEMANQNMFRIVRVHDDGIAAYNKIENDKGESEGVYYKVRYYMSTWMNSNTLETEPVYDQGTLYLEIDFKPELRETIKTKKYSIRDYLQSGNNPAVLFKFRVLNIKENTVK